MPDLTRAKEAVLRGLTPLLALVGAPGSGKSSVAHAAGERMGLPVWDTDAILAAESGLSVAELLIEAGEKRFRELELDAARICLERDEGIAALGSGSVLNASLRRELASHQTVWLDVDATRAARRCGINASLPGLFGSVRSTLIRQLAERRPLYAECSTHRVDTSTMDLAGVVDEVLAFAAAARTR